MNECLSSPCQHGGSCAEDGITFKCYCPIGYNGTTCQYRKKDSDLATTSIFNDLTSIIDTGTSTTLSMSTTSNDFSSTTTGSVQSISSQTTSQITVPVPSTSNGLLFTNVVHSTQQMLSTLSYSLSSPTVEFSAKSMTDTFYLSESSTNKLNATILSASSMSSTAELNTGSSDILHPTQFSLPILVSSSISDNPAQSSVLVSQAPSKLFSEMLPSISVMSSTSELLLPISSSMMVDNSPTLTSPPPLSPSLPYSQESSSSTIVQSTGNRVLPTPTPDSTQFEAKFSSFISGDATIMSTDSISIATQSPSSFISGSDSSPLTDSILFPTISSKSPISTEKNLATINASLSMNFTGSKFYCLI